MGLYNCVLHLLFLRDPNADPKAERSGKHRRGADGIIRPSPAVFCGLHGLADDAADGVGGVTLHPLRGVGVGAESEARVVVSQRTGQRPDVHAVLGGQCGERVTNAMVRLGGLADTHSFFRALYAKWFYLHSVGFGNAEAAVSGALDELRSLSEELPLYQKQIQRFFELVLDIDKAGRISDSEFYARSEQARVAEKEMRRGHHHCRGFPAVAEGVVDK